jgi:hypothetical protein
MANLENVERVEVLTLLAAEQTFRLQPAQAFSRGGRFPQPFLGALRDRPDDGQIWPRGEYTATASVGGNQPEVPAFATTVTVTPTPFSVIASPATTQQLTARAFDEDGNELFGHDVGWVSSDPTKATVSSTGLVTGVATGDVTISAVIDGAVGTASCHIYATSPTVDHVTVTPDPFAVGEGNTVQLTATAYNSSNVIISGKTFTWATSDGTKATVDSNGLVTGVLEGSVTITATTDSVDGTADGEILPGPDVSDPLYYFSCNETSTAPLISSGRGGGGHAPGSSIVLPGEVVSAFHMEKFTAYSGKGCRNTATDGVYQPTDALARFNGNQSWSLAVRFNLGEGSWGSGENYLMDHNGIASPQCQFLVRAGGTFKARAGSISVNNDYESGISSASLSAGWHHIAVVNDVAANKLRFYLDGVLISSQAAINVVAVDSGVYGVGSFIGNNFSSTKPWGSFDELYIFDRAINAASVALLAA